MISLDSEVIDGPKDLNVHHVDSFLHPGYLVVPDMIDVNELDDLKRDIIDVARGRYPCDNIEPINDDVSDEEVIERLQAPVPIMLIRPCWRLHRDDAMVTMPC